MSVPDPLSLKHLVPDQRCERALPSLADLGDGHRSLCWLGNDVLKEMDPVIRFEGRGRRDKAYLSRGRDRPH